MVLCTSLDGTIACSYCTPEDVMKAIRMIDLYDVNMGILQPSDSSLPDYDELCQRITVAEKFIDRYTGQSWKENRIVRQLCDVNTYWHDENAMRSEYWQQGGYFIPLHKDIIEFDPLKGDKLECRTRGNQWIDVSNCFIDGLERNHGIEEGTGPYKAQYVAEDRFWFDYAGGMLYLRLGFLQPTQNAIRITYRWGAVDEVPPDIKRATALKVGLTLLNEELYLSKIGQGGDIGSSKNDMRKGMQDEINEILYANRSFTSVYSAYE